MESIFSFSFFYLELFYSIIYVLVDSSCFISKWTKKYVLKKIILIYEGFVKSTHFVLYFSYFPILLLFYYFFFIFLLMLFDVFLYCRRSKDAVSLHIPSTLHLCEELRRKPSQNLRRTLSVRISSCKYIFNTRLPGCFAPLS